MRDNSASPLVWRPLGRAKETSARPRKSPLAAVVQGLAAGLVGTAVFTAYQELRKQIARSGSEQSEGSTEQPDEDGKPEDWSEAPVPAQVGQRIVAGLFKRDVSTEHADLLTNAMHWLYGTSWGALYGVLEETRRRPVANGVAVAAGVMAADYTLLPAMKLYEPPWRYPAKTLGKDFANHLVYGFAVAGAYRALDRVTDRR